MLIIQNLHIYNNPFEFIITIITSTVVSCFAYHLMIAVHTITEA